jgi:hypothetical protein
LAKIKWVPSQMQLLAFILLNFLLEEMVTIHINFMAASTHDARFNDWEVKFSVKHQLEIRTGKAKISKSLGSVEECSMHRAKDR